jgi:hypothetical protein
MGVIVPNRPEAEERLLEPPRRPDGTFYRFEMIADGGWSRFYDDDPNALLNFLIPGYLGLNESDQLEARIRHAVDLQVRLQARINDFYNDARRTPDEHALLTGPRHIQPSVDEWISPIPLVLVDAFYIPFSEQPSPLSVAGDVLLTPNLWWLRPARSPMDYLMSLHEVGLIELHASADEVI